MAVSGTLYHPEELEKGVGRGGQGSSEAIQLTHCACEATWKGLGQMRSAPYLSSNSFPRFDWQVLTPWVLPNLAH